MSIVNSLERAGAWLADEVCKGVELKPMSPDAPQSQKFDYHLVRPSVHVVYMPSHTDKPPDMEATVPAIVIQLMESKDDLLNQTRQYNLRLSFTAWDPGLHGPDVINPVDGDDVPDGSVGSYELGPPGTCRTNGDGWRDAFNFMDRALRIIENKERLGSLGLVKSEGISFGNFEWQNAPDELFPFWLCWARLSVEERLTRNRLEIDEML